MIKPYFDDGDVSLYLGDMREILPALEIRADCIVADPPYGETRLTWDQWPHGWPDVAAAATDSMWCFGSMRMFLDQVSQFARWRFSQDVIWEKENGTGFATDRFKRVHEIALHWYRGAWGDVHHDTPRVPHNGPRHKTRNRYRGPTHTDHIGLSRYEDDGTRLVRSVLKAKSIRRGLHPTEKPTQILDPLIRYACPAGGLVLDPFAGSGSTLDAARSAGRRAIGIEANEAYIEKAARRLSQPLLFPPSDLANGPDAPSEEITE